VKSARTLTAIIEREDGGFVALCPELDIASQGTSIEDARANLIEALSGFNAVRQRGSHRIMQKQMEETTITVPVPLHDPVRRGTSASFGSRNFQRSAFEVQP
jgi:predicted RNase H-like HicB family nuclease